MIVLRTSLLVLFLFALGSIKAQKGEVINQIYEGNTLMETEVYDEAEMAFRKALSKSPERTEALYNLGNTHFNEQDYEEAKQRYFQTQKFANNNASKHHAFHNMGNVFMKQKDYAKAVETYKNALRNNPEDDETRYNLALAKKCEEEQQNKDDQNKDDQNKDDQNKDDQNKDDQNKDDQNKDDQNKDDQNKDDQNKDNQSKPKENKNQQSKLSPQQIKNLLKAMENAEKKVQAKVNDKKQKGTKVVSEKDW